MKSIWLLYVLFPIAGFCNPLTDVEGQDLIQKKIIWVWQHRTQIFQSCLTEVKICGKADELSPEMLKISDILKKNISTRLLFVSEAKRPDLFKSDAGETHRVAVTGNTAGSDVFLNVDRIKTLSFEQIVGILFHELSHHTGLADDTLRKPDQIGARVAKHFMQQLKLSYHNQQEAPQLFAGAFQTFLPETVDGRNNFSNFGFVSDGVSFFNINFMLFELSSPCIREGAFPVGQHTARLNWKTLTNSKINVSSAIDNFCIWINPENQEPKLDIVPRGFDITFSLTPDYLIVRESITGGLSDNLMTFVDRVGTVEFLNVKFDKSKYNPNDMVQADIELKSFTAISFSNCESGLSHADSPRQKNGWPFMENVTSCEVLSLNGSLIKLRLKYQLSDLQKTGQHFFPYLKLKSNVKNEFAIVDLLKLQVKFEVSENIISNNPMQLVSLGGSNIVPVGALGTYPLTNSFMFQDQSTWTIDIRIRSKYQITLCAFYASFFVKINGKLAEAEYGGEPKDLEMIKKIEYLSEGENKLIQLTIQMPEVFFNNPLYGFNLADLIIQDEAKNFLPFKKESPYQYSFLSKTLVDMPQ